MLSLTQLYIATALAYVVVAPALEIIELALAIIAELVD